MISPDHARTPDAVTCELLFQLNHYNLKVLTSNMPINLNYQYKPKPKHKMLMEIKF